MRPLLVSCLVALSSLGTSAIAERVEFFFGSRQAGVDGLANAEIVASGVGLSLSATPNGAVLSEISSGGLGVNSRGIAGATDGSNDKFDLLGGALQGQADGLTFWFDTPGVITELHFDGVKDESFEFFTLTTPSGDVYSLFDSQVGLRLSDTAAIDQPNVTLLSETGGADDDLLGIAIPFEAGAPFTLVYGEYFPEPNELAPGFTPDAGNGARFQGVVIDVIPEPTGLVTAAGAISLLCARTSRSSRK